MASSSVSRQITAIGSITIIKNIDDVNSLIYSNNVFPTNVGANTFNYTDNSDPINIPLIPGFLTSTNGYADLSGNNMFTTYTFAWSGATYPTS